MEIKHQQQTEDVTTAVLTATVSHKNLGMTTSQDVSAHRRRLGSELRNERNLAHLTQKRVARAMDWSPSKMLRIETGSNSISVTDLRALLSYYNLNDKQRIEDLIDLARAAKSGAVREMRHRPDEAGVVIQEAQDRQRSQQTNSSGGITNEGDDRILVMGALAIGILLGIRSNLLPNVYQRATRCTPQDKASQP